MAGYVHGMRDMKTLTDGSETTAGFQVCRTVLNTHPNIAGTTALKQSKYGKPAHAINTVAVLGAGLMGAGT